jgi:hypothetical protein
VAWGGKLAAASLHPVVAAVVVLIPYGLVYVGATAFAGVPEASDALVRFRRLRG